MDQIRDLIALMGTPQLQVKQAALEALLPYTQKSAGMVFLFKENDMAGINYIQVMITNEELERNALTAMINLAEDKAIRDHIAGNMLSLSRLMNRAENPKEKHAGLVSMLLANLSHSEHIENIIGPLLNGLVKRFVDDLSGPLDYLAYVFAETARTTAGGQFWTGKDTPQNIPVAALYPQILVTSENRRAGIAATMKNSVFDIESHKRIVATGIIEYIMLALKGPEEMDPRDFEELPELVRESAGSDKKREDVPGIQLVHIETLLILSSSTAGRTALRDHHAYYIVRELHLASQNEEVVAACERFVNMVMRGEPANKEDQEQNEDNQITEVV